MGRAAESQVAEPGSLGRAAESQVVQVVQVVSLLKRYQRSKMSTDEFEIQLLVEYSSAAKSSSEPEVIAKHIALYEKQLLTCKSKGLISNSKDFDALLYFLKAKHELLRETFVESVPAQSMLGSIAHDQAFKGRLRKAIALLNQAIELNDDPDYRLIRAKVYQELKDKPAALQDLEYLLNNYRESEIYSEARKLKDEIETSQSKCFVATAVYGSPLAPEVMVFRQYRDVRLRRNWLGCLAISVYERISPPLANWIKKRPTARYWVQRYVLTPALWFVQRFVSQ